ncbi:Rieske 2Fe-2S domain-containing protein [Candidatus Nitrosocosmicus franklandus]|uniref:Biphenyl dioxygenase system ferredoxin subunit n=1 Tax=Candidatus Nitrosocosmicus franklandianus TaxID=1798806 RepID=A0A484IGT1_9ARCH|nr:Rieske 2Fe-2S domain-containing protein [Candidatus Nitrosocosmicus franklandus]VFJ14864.1 Biphenyl dioxygenase system ferredoxin subunit [Candidatus Nitrosocosmicus franklandus]
MEDKEFVRVADIQDIPSSKMKEVQVEGESICIINVNGKYYAIGSICTHEGGPLADGTLDEYEIECPWHNSKFDVRTGEVTSPPASEPEPVYEVKTEGSNILIKVHSKGKSPPLVELELLEKVKVEGTDVMSFKFSKQKSQTVIEGQQTPLSDYNAGQFAFFDIGDVSNDPKGPIRHFTLSSSPTEDFIMFTTRIRESPYKKRLAVLEEGANVKVKGPEGQFVLHEDYTKPAIFISGGIGVTPFRSMIKYVIDKKLPLKIVMFDSNKNQDNILFKKEFDDWSSLNENLRIIYTISEDNRGEYQSHADNNWKGEYGRINKSMILKYLDNPLLNNAIFYICGPPGMLKAMKLLLQEELKISSEKIKIEEFTGY